MVMLAEDGKLPMKILLGPVPVGKHVTRGVGIGPEETGTPSTDLGLGTKTVANCRDRRELEQHRPGMRVGLKFRIIILGPWENGWRMTLTLRPDILRTSSDLRMTTTKAYQKMISAFLNTLSSRNRVNDKNKRSTVPFSRSQSTRDRQQLQDS
jgi:hypothetical protein